MDELGRAEFIALGANSPQKWTLSSQKMEDGATCAFIRARFGSLEATIIGRRTCRSCSAVSWSCGLAKFGATSSATVTVFAEPSETLAQLVTRAVGTARAFALAIGEVAL
jgi:hypothetical protein